MTDLKGFIALYNSEKGFGFICQESGNRIFFHVSDCLINEDQIQFGRNVNYETQEYMKGDQKMKKAVNIKLPEADQE